jgi:hypothetical protein
LADARGLGQRPGLRGIVGGGGGRRGGGRTAPASGAAPAAWRTAPPAARWVSCNALPAGIVRFVSTISPAPANASFAPGLMLEFAPTGGATATREAAAPPGASGAGSGSGPPGTGCASWASACGAP